MKIFIEISEEGGFSAAARKLRLQQSAVSRTLGLLEAEFATPLLTRTTRKFSLTEAGTRYLLESKRILADVEALESKLKRIREEPRGILRINLSTAFGKWAVVPLLADFKRLFPEVTLEIHLEDRLVDLISEGFDVVIRVGGTEDSRVTARKIAIVRRGLFASKMLLKKEGPILKPADLERFPAIIFDDRAHPDQKWILAQGRSKQVVKIKALTTVNQLDGIFELACDGLGVAQLPLFIARSARGPEQIQQVLPDWEILGEVGSMDRVYALFTGGRNCSAKVRVFVDYLVDCLSKSFE